MHSGLEVEGGRRRRRRHGACRRCISRRAATRRGSLCAVPARCCSGGFVVARVWRGSGFADGAISHWLGRERRGRRRRSRRHHRAAYRFGYGRSLCWGRRIRDLSWCLSRRSLGRCRARSSLVRKAHETGDSQADRGDSERGVDCRPPSGRVFRPRARTRSCRQGDPRAWRDRRVAFSRCVLSLRCGNSSAGSWKRVREFWAATGAGSTPSPSFTRSSSRSRTGTRRASGRRAAGRACGQRSHRARAERAGSAHWACLRRLAGA